MNFVERLDILSSGHPASDVLLKIYIESPWNFNAANVTKLEAVKR